MKTFTFYWFNGHKTICKGTDRINAFVRAGYGTRALSALDFYEEGENREYRWNPKSKTWQKSA